MIVCSCNVLSCGQIKGTVAADGSGPRTAGEVYDCLGCSPDCGRCAREVRAILAEARAVCVTQCGSCASREIACAVHVSVGLMFEGIAREEESAAA
ncbi:(2Fe-2S)-binding protein [Bosea sp. (in: a-proteobacteria)]|uniref:(2Fe-2S)-binding protein n=1 Tax=Bosea sp. (in: a-proteobacteria) TaxID=1871050 RepID=UPI0026073D7B|nr:(2Fe-2S)-binding protein [Bosea sp. (in: a-proteobacteria)]MCO5090801.1 (2Fe-2S)-binding protein [Bosea sp. (in: a-proteobacteria)]